MNRLAVVFVILIGLALIFWAFLPRRNDVAGQRNAKAADQNSQGNLQSWRFAIEGTSIDMNGRITSFALPEQDSKDVEVRLANKGTISVEKGRVNATFEVTFKSEQPVVLTKQAYDKIQSGMTYPQIAEALGGMMTKGQMSEGFSSKLELIQGKRRIELTFLDGKVTEKSAKDLE
jgi:hypothetical protein